MSGEPSGENPDFLNRIPLFREFARLLAGGGGPVNWELARQVAVATAAGADALGAAPQVPRPPASPPASEQHDWDERLRLAELWVDPATTVPSAGVALTSRPVSRPDWAEAVLKGFAPLVEPGARRISEALGGSSQPQLPAEMADMVGRVGSLLTGMQVGTVVGRLAHLVLGQHDLPVAVADGTGVRVISDNVTELERAVDAPGDQLRLWVACHEVARARVLDGVGWYGDHLHGLVADVAKHTDPDPGGLMERLQGLDVGKLESLQELFEGSEGLLGAPSPPLKAALGQLETLLALTEGYAVVLSGRALDGRLPRLAAIEAAMLERAGDSEGTQALFAQLLRADPGRASGAVGARFCREVLAATDIDGLDRCWAHPNFLPTSEELAVPGRWLERVGLVGGTEVDLDEGLRALLEGDEPDGDGEQR